MCLILELACPDSYYIEKRMIVESIHLKRTEKVLFFVQLFSYYGALMAVNICTIIKLNI